MKPEYRREHGVVTEIKNGRATIRIDQEEVKGCGTCCSCSSYCSNEFKLTVPDEGYSEGQDVTVGIPVTSKYLSLLLLFILPMLAFAGGAVIGSIVSVEGVDDQAGAVLGAFLGFGIAFAIAFVVNKHLVRRHPILVEPEGASGQRQKVAPSQQT